MVKAKISRWLLVAIWAGAIFAFSSVPQIKVSDFLLWDFIAKKTAHVAEYAILFTLIFRATDGSWVKSFVLTMIYAVSDEYHQSLVPGRTPSVFDLGFDLTGANIASYIIWKLNQVRQKKPKK